MEEVQESLDRYPRWKFHPNGDERQVRNEREEDLLGAAWADMPFADIQQPDTEAPAPVDSAAQAARIAELEADNERLKAELDQLSAEHGALTEAHDSLQTAKDALAAKVAKLAAAAKAPKSAKKTDTPPVEEPAEQKQ